MDIDTLQLKDTSDGPFGINWHEVIEICHYNRGSANKKCRVPTNTEPLLKVLTELGLHNVSAEELRLPKNFCKKDPRTQLQKQIKCLACRCQMESPDAFAAHLKGDKHAKSFTSYFEYKSKLPKADEPSQPKVKNLRDKIDVERKPVVGLNYVQEFLPPKDADGEPMYKCMLYECDGAWGSLEKFSIHLGSKSHIVACLKENGSISKLICKEYTLDEIKEKAKQFESDGYESVEVIRDQERYEIQRQRLGRSRGENFKKPMVPVNKASKNEEEEVSKLLPNLVPFRKGEVGLVCNGQRDWKTARV